MAIWTELSLATQEHHIRYIVHSRRYTSFQSAIPLCDFSSLIRGPTRARLVPEHEKALFTNDDSPALLDAYDFVYETGIYLGISDLRISGHFGPRSTIHSSASAGF